MQTAWRVIGGRVGVFAKTLWLQILLQTRTISLRFMKIVAWPDNSCLKASHPWRMESTLVVELQKQIKKKKKNNFCKHGDKPLKLPWTLLNKCNRACKQLAFSPKKKQIWTHGIEVLSLKSLLQLSQELVSLPS